MKKLLCIALSIIMCISFSSTAFATEIQNADIRESIEYENSIEPRMDGYYTWELTSKGSNTETYGKWGELCRKYTNGSSKAILTGELTTSVSHSVTGNLQVTIAKLTSYLGLAHTIGIAWSRTVSDSEPLEGLSKGTYAIKWRKVYNTQPVTQTKYYHIDGSKVKVGTEVVTVKKFKSISFKFEKISSSNVT